MRIVPFAAGSDTRAVPSATPRYGGHDGRPAKPPASHRPTQAPLTLTAGIPSRGMTAVFNASACWAKTDRAREHIVGLETAWQEWLDSEPTGLVFRPGSPGEWHVVFVLQSYPPLRLGVILGDIVHNLASALDQLVARAVEASGEKVRRHHGFPICRTPAQYEKASERQLAGIPAGSRFREIVAETQPFGAGDPSGHPLYVLNDLWNADKHRTVAPRLIYADQATILGAIEWDPAETTITAARWPHPQDRPLEDHTLLATFEVDASDARPHRRAEPIEYELRFGDVDPVRVEISEIASTVETTVRRTGQEWTWQP